MYKLKTAATSGLLIALLALSGCSASRRAVESGSRLEKYGRGSSADKAIAENNLAGKGFFISKAKVRYSEDGTEISFTANIRVNSNGDLLASVRSFAGIEVARVTISNGEVHILEKLGRKVVYFSLDSLAGGYGMGQNGVMALFGDRPEIEGQKKSALKCKDGEGSVTTKVNNIYLIEDADCLIGKLRKVIVAGSTLQTLYSLSYADFIEVEQNIMPSHIRFESGLYLFHVEINIEKIEFGWDGDINFIQPSGYKMQRLKW